MLPALAQVAAQEGEYLAKCFNKMKFCEENPEGLLHIRGEGRHHFKPISPFLRDKIQNEHIHEKVGVAIVMIKLERLTLDGLVI
ncbi:NAD(P)H dehydrogenase B3, mitochondrial [Dendrobium catenatum]|uniref:NAD(P)H dehydrogenase B3, mitochondrial n=1 Tax=Dendrobium catenatum TaxID=906689 RepID=A0A2I0XD16_9ASPA|nr:NAD(P)H dehydrogenase B3, mitochondrial [Dendrobium catenatum]